jgi:hypothetical protein
MARRRQFSVVLRSRRRPIAALAAIFALSVPSGCGPSTDRLAVSGRVSLDGQPLDNGSIRFTSLGENLVSSGTLIKDGRYRIPRDKGLLPGEYRVEISSPDNDAPPVMQRSSPKDPGIPTAVDRIPPGYNINSDQRVQVDREKDNAFDFDIVSKSTR